MQGIGKNTDPESGCGGTSADIVDEAPQLDGTHSQIEDGIELDAKVTMRLGRQLSSFYGELVKEPVPDQFLKLLEELDKREKSA